MLVPAMTFAWWLVSMSASAPHNPAELSRTAQKRSTAVTPAEAQDDTRDTSDEDESSPGEQALDGEGEVADDPPSTRVRLKVVTPEIVRMAKSFLDLPMGAQRSVRIDGRRYLFVLERHYHPPGFVGGPQGWHKGVTVYGTR
jgi:hypothetical protein